MAHNKKFYGRISSRLSIQQKVLLSELYALYGLTVADFLDSNVTADPMLKYDTKILEVGFGSGDFLYHLAEMQKKNIS